MDNNKDDFFARMLHEARQNSEPFSPLAYYNPDGDCVEFFISSDPYYGKWLDHFVTEYRSQDNDELIGFSLDGVAEICSTIARQYSDLLGEPSGARFKVALIIRARLLIKAGKIDLANIEPYNRMIALAELVDAEFEFLGTNSSLNS